MLNNSVIKENRAKGMRLHIYHVNAWSTGYFISHLASCFKRVKHVQNLSLQDSKIQEVRYTKGYTEGF